MIRKFLLSFTYFCLVATYSIHANSYKAYSPDGKLVASIYTNDGELFYNLSHHNLLLIDGACLGIIVNGVNYGKHSGLDFFGRKEIYEEYPVQGNHPIALNHCWQYNYTIRNPEGECILNIRMYNDGFAFRYHTGVEEENFVKKEFSGFIIPEGARVWFCERPTTHKLKSYAGEWISTAADSLHVISPGGPVQCPPLVAELPDGNGFVVFTEAALYNYSGMRLEALSGRKLQANFTEQEGFKVDGEVLTPWRVVMFAKNLNSLVNSDIITNLNPQPSPDLFDDMSWIKPGRSLWSWFSLAHENPELYLKEETEWKYIDYAHQIGFEYTLIDAGWEILWPDKWNVLRKLCDYGREKGVGVFAWKHSNQLDNPENDYAVMAAFLDSLKMVGCKGIKIDFINGEAYHQVLFYEAALRLAAERRLMVNFHGCQKPTGEMRTYPNEITREGVRGMELNRDKLREPFVNASHNAALPFTRGMLGQTDYTPVSFQKAKNTTWAHQLATGYIFDSRMIIMAENPGFIYETENLHPVIPFLGSMHSTWDETIVLDGSQIGKLAAFARRKGTDWYIAVINGEDVSKEFISSLEFTGFDTNELQIIHDVQGDVFQIATDEKKVDKHEVLRVTLQPHGGFVAHCRKW